MQLTVLSSAGVAGARPSNASEESVWVTVFSVSTEIAGNAGTGAAAGADVFAAVHAQSPNAAARTMGRIIHPPAAGRSMLGNDTPQAHPRTDGSCSRLGSLSGLSTLREDTHFPHTLTAH